MGNLEEPRTGQLVGTDVWASRRVLGAIGLWENPTKIPAGEEKAAILLCSLRRACVLDLNLFPEGMRKASQLECVSCHPSPNTQTPFRSLHAMFGQNSVLTHFLVPLPSCGLQRESSQNTFWVQASLSLALEKGCLICKITLKLSREALEFWMFLIANTHSFPSAKKRDIFWPVYPK